MNLIFNHPSLVPNLFSSISFHLEQLYWSLFSKGAYLFAREAIPELLSSVPKSAHPPSLIFTGATASVRGSAQCASFASGKFAVRALSQSLAREFGPQGVHVSHVIVDGVIDIPKTKNWDIGNGKPDAKISSAAVSTPQACRTKDWLMSNIFSDAKLVDCRCILAPSHPASFLLYLGDRPKAVGWEVVVPRIEASRMFQGVNLKYMSCYSQIWASD